MKNLLYTIILVFTYCTSVGQTIKHVHAGRRIKDSISNEINIALAGDQRYRWMLQLGTMDKHELDSLRGLDDNAKFRRMALVSKDKVGMARIQKDSLSRLQSEIDSLNFLRMSGILYKYGYPKSKNDRYYMSVIFMHCDAFIDTGFLSMMKNEVLDGNVEALEYAILYDRYMDLKHLPKLYFVNQVYKIGNDAFEVETPADLAATNKARAEIGLELLKK
jgi:hypothetical protein